ncbi:hypothetical protein ACFX19_043504 [Malus domestica]
MTLPFLLNDLFFLVQRPTTSSSWCRDQRPLLRLADPSVLQRRISDAGASHRPIRFCAGGRRRPPRNARGSTARSRRFGTILTYGILKDFGPSDRARETDLSPFCKF